MASPPENVHTLGADRKSVLLVGNCKGRLFKSCGPQHHHSLSFVHQNHILVDTLQLARTGSKKQNYRSQRNKVRTFRDFLDPGAKD